MVATECGASSPVVLGVLLIDHAKFFQEHLKGEDVLALLPENEFFPFFEALFKFFDGVGEGDFLRASAADADFVAAAAILSSAILQVTKEAEVASRLGSVLCCGARSIPPGGLRCVGVWVGARFQGPSSLRGEDRAPGEPVLGVGGGACGEQGEQ